MSEQYAFAIAFEPHGADSDAQGLPPDWLDLISQIEKKIALEGFPLFDDDRWDAFGDGYLYWGSKLDCDRIKACLSSFPLSFYEERNLDAGYYACSFGVYHVDTSGHILCLDLRSDSVSSLDIYASETIPLEALRTDQLDPEIEAIFQQARLRDPDEPLPQNWSTVAAKVATASSEQDDSSTETSEQHLPPAAVASEISRPDRPNPVDLEPQIAQLQQELAQERLRAEAKVSPEVVASLNQVVSDHKNQLQAQAQVIEQNQSQMHDLQLMLDRKVDPEVHAHLQQHATAQTEQIAELEQELQQLKQVHAQVLALESQRISAAEYERLGHVSAEQGKTIIDLEAKVQLLQASLDEAQHELSNKIDKDVLNNALAKSTQQSELIHRLQLQVQDLTAQLQQEAGKIDPSTLERVTQEKGQLETQIQTLQQDKRQLLAEVGKWSQVANTKVAPEQFEALRGEADAQAQHIRELNQIIDQLQLDVDNWKQISATRVEQREYEAALAEIERIQALRSRSWLERIKRWFLR